MTATAKLQVRDDMRITITLDMDLQEVRALLKATMDSAVWPIGDFRTVLHQSLSVAMEAYSSEKVITR